MPRAKTEVASNNTDWYYVELYQCVETTTYVTLCENFMYNYLVVANLVM